MLQCDKISDCARGVSIVPPRWVPVGAARGLRNGEGRHREKFMVGHYVEISYMHRL